MSVARSIFVNTAWLAIGEIVTNIMVAIGGVLLARELGNAQYGQLGFATSFVALFTIIPEFGINLLFINEAARNRELEKTYFAQLVGLKAVLGLVFLGVVALAVQLTDKPAEIKLLVYYLAAGLAVSTMTTLLAALFRIREEMKYEAILRIMSGLVSFCTVLAVVVWHLGYVRLVQAGLGVNLAMLAVYGLFIARRYLPIKLNFNWNLWKQLLVKAFPLGVSIAFVSIYYHLNSVMLSFWKTDEVVGWYNADYKFILMLLAFFGIYHSVIFPVLSRLLVQDRDTAKLVIQKSIKLMVAFSIPLAVGMSVIAKPLLEAFFGVQFVGGAPALQALIWSVTIFSVGAIFGNALVAAGQRTVYMWGVALGALANVVANILLIPKFSAVGAGLSTVIAELVVCIYMYFGTKRLLFSAPFLGYLVRPLLASAVMLGLLLLAPVRPIVVPIAIGVISYGLILLALRGFAKDELLFFRSILKRRQPTDGFTQPPT